MQTHPAFAVLFFIAAANVRAATLHVTPGGNDANPGTEAQPWATLRKAAASVQPGDTVRIKAGEYFVPDGWSVRKAGAPDKPITWQAFGDGEVRITSSTVLPAGGWTLVKGGIYSTTVDKAPTSVFQNTTPLHHPGERAKIHSVDDMIPNSFYKSDKTLYVWLEDGSDPGKSVVRVSAGHVVELRECHHNVFEGLTVEYGFNGFKDQGESTHHITIRKCTIRSISSQGIQPVARDCVIEENLFQKIGSNKYQHGIYGSQPGTIIRHNVFEEIAGAGIHQYNQSKPAGGGCEFHGNTFRKPLKMTVRPGGNIYYTDIIAWGEGSNRIYNNLFYGEGKRSGISLNSIDNHVYHNTFTGSVSGIGFHAGKPGNRVMNNIVVDAGRTFLTWPAGALPQTLDHNLYYNVTAATRWERDGVRFKNFKAYQEASGETHSRLENPHLAGPADARLTNGSPAIDAATAVSGAAADFNRLPRPQGTASDIGAFEFPAGASAPPK